MDAIRVTVQRGDVVEAVHRVHVRSTDGRRSARTSSCFLRSSLKPIQAVPLLEGYDDLDSDELAIASASHQAEPAQLEAVRKLLARAGAEADDLECGTQDGRPDGPLGHNCSGKHAGMLAACRAHDWPLHPYRELSHPLQQRVAELVGPADVAVDGCGVPTFALTLSGMAALFATTRSRSQPRCVSIPSSSAARGADDTDLMRALPGWMAKRGAEGLLTALGHDGVAWAFKAEDGSTRALRPAIGQVLGIESFRTVDVRNTLGEVVGSVR